MCRARALHFSSLRRESYGIKVHLISLTGPDGVNVEALDYAVFPDDRSARHAPQSERANPRIRRIFVDLGLSRSAETLNQANVGSGRKGVHALLDCRIVVACPVAPD